MGLPFFLFSTKFRSKSMDLRFIYMDRLRVLLWGLLVCAVLTLLFGCRGVEYVQVPSVSVDSVYVDRWLRDSVYLRDSVFVNQWMKGDTVFVDKVVTKYKYKDRWRYDTVAIVRRDIVQVPYPVEKQLSIWEMTKIVFCSPLIISIVLMTVGCVGWLISWFVKKLRKK